MLIQLNDLTLAYDEAGAGLPVLWIHGYPLTRTLWTPQICALTDCGRHITPDLRGFGESNLPPGEPTLDQYADDMAALLTALDIERAVIAGLSMGGYIALAFARRHAQRMLGLILADTRADADQPEAAQARRDNAKRAQNGEVQAVVGPMLSKLLAPATQSDNPAVVQDARAMLDAARPEGVAYALLAMAARPDSRPHLGEIQVPTLIVVGAEDKIAPPIDASQMAALIPGASLVVLSRAGHLSNLEQPEAFNNAVRAFLGEIQL